MTVKQTAKTLKMLYPFSDDNNRYMFQHRMMMSVFQVPALYTTKFTMLIIITFIQTINQPLSLTLNLFYPL